MILACVPLISTSPYRNPLAMADARTLSAPPAATRQSRSYGDIVAVTLIDRHDRAAPRRRGGRIERLNGRHATRNSQPVDLLAVIASHVTAEGEYVQNYTCVRPLR